MSTGSYTLVYHSGAIAVVFFTSLATSNGQEMTSSGRVPTLSFAWEGFLTPERSMAQDRIHVQLTIRVGQLFTLGSIDISPGSHPLAVGNLNNVRLSASQVSKVISILSQHNICCCFVEKFALIYYSANREPNVLYMYVFFML